MRNFTTDDLLLFLYDEMDNNDAVLLKQQLTHDWATNEKFEVFKEMTQRLSRMPLIKPRRKSVDDILRYASSGTVTSF